MKKLNLSKQNFQFFLAGQTTVESLETGAKLYGGATMYGTKVVSNIENGETVTISETNRVSVFVPSTFNVDKQATSEKFDSIMEFVKTCFINAWMVDNSGYDMEVTETKGSWYSEDNNTVVIEDIHIVSIQLKDITQFDIDTLKFIAEEIKSEMSQEGVSIAINEALAII